MPRPRRLVPLLGLVLLTACGPISGLNPLRWFGGTAKGPETLEPEGGFTREDMRPPIAQVTGARWEPLGEGRLLVVTGLAPTKGWWDAALVPETAMPAGRIRADDDGVLRLRFVASPPPPDLAESRIPARPEVDTITVALTLSSAALRGIEQVAIQGAGNAVTLRR
jgi:hypothetical protein